MKNTSEQDEKVCLVTWPRLLVLQEHTEIASLWPLYRSHCSIPSFHSQGWSGDSVWGRWKLPPWGHWPLSTPTKALRLQSGRTSTWHSNTVLPFRNPFKFKFPVQCYLQDSSSRSIDDQKLGYPFFVLILTATVNILFDLYPPQLSVTVPYKDATFFVKGLSEVPKIVYGNKEYYSNSMAFRSNEFYTFEMTKQSLIVDTWWISHLSTSWWLFHAPHPPEWLVRSCQWWLHSYCLGRDRYCPLASSCLVIHICNKCTTSITSLAKHIAIQILCVCFLRKELISLNSVLHCCCTSWVGAWPALSWVCVYPPLCSYFQIPTIH